MNRIERIKPREGSEPVRLTILSRLERERQQDERERRRRHGAPASGGDAGRDGEHPSASPPGGEPAHRLDLRA